MKKFKPLKVARPIVQLIFFILISGLYVLTFGEVKTVYTMLINGDFNFLKALPTLIEFISLMIGTFLLGRFFCGWICTFGAFNDLLFYIGKKLFKSPIKISEKLHSKLVYLKYIILIGILILTCNLGITIQGTSPWDAFVEILNIQSLLSDFLIGFVLLIAIAVGSMFIERFFCKYLCPLGAIFSLISRISIFKINKPSEKCGKCRACTSKCSMGLSLYKKESVRGGECINCLTCVETCPRKNITTAIVNEEITPALAGSLALAGCIGIYGATSTEAKILNNVVVQTSISSDSTTTSQTITDNNNNTPTYADGIYKGSGTGFRNGTTTLSVTIKNGKITAIDTISTDDTPKFYNRASQTVIKEIISAQSTDVDVVSGATYTSNGIMEAVSQALQSVNSNNTAKSNSSANNTTTNNTYTNDNTSNSTPTDNSTAISTGTYKNGTYTGSGTGFKHGTTTLSVTVSDGKITNIETLSTDDTPRFYSRASQTVFNEILSSQSTDVDTVSGATYTSRGIMEAVAAALNN